MSQRTAPTPVQMKGRHIRGIRGVARRWRWAARAAAERWWGAVGCNALPAPCRTFRPVRPSARYSMGAAGRCTIAGEAGGGSKALARPPCILRSMVAGDTRSDQWVQSAGRNEAGKGCQPCQVGRPAPRLARSSRCLAHKLRGIFPAFLQQRERCSPARRLTASAQLPCSGWRLLRLALSCSTFLVRISGRRPAIAPLRREAAPQRPARASNQGSGAPHTLSTARRAAAGGRSARWATSKTSWAWPATAAARHPSRRKRMSPSW